MDDSPLHGYSPARQFASASNIHSPGGHSHGVSGLHSPGGHSHGVSGLTPAHSRLASSPLHGAEFSYQQWQQFGSISTCARRSHLQSPLPPRTRSDIKQRSGHRLAKSMDLPVNAGQQELALSSSVFKCHHQEDRLADPWDSTQEAKLNQLERNCDTITTDQETSLSASASGSYLANANATGVRRQHHNYQPTLIPTHHHAGQYQGIEIFSPQVRSEKPHRRRYDDDGISDTSSISTAMSTLVHDDPQQRQVKIIGMQRAIRNYEIIQASSSESTDDEDNGDAMQSKAKSLMDVAGTFSTDSDEDDENRTLNKMLDQTQKFQEWLTMGLGGSGRDTSHVNDQDAKATWMWKPAPLDIPATLERQSNGRGGLLKSLGSASSSRRSLLSRGLVPEESSKTMMAENNKGIEQNHFREHASSAQEFLQSAEKLEQRARKREEERGRSGGEREEAVESGMSFILRMIGESFFKCNGY